MPTRSKSSEEEKNQEIKYKECNKKDYSNKRKEKHDRNEKAFLGTVNTESFEVWDKLPQIQRTEEALGKLC